jgi:hypothetical protein
VIGGGHLVKLDTYDPVSATPLMQLRVALLRIAFPCLLALRDVIWLLQDRDTIG